MPATELNLRRRSPEPVDELTVIVISHNTRDHLRACLQSLREEAPDRIVVVDNASTDGSFEMVGTEFPEATLVPNDRNLGYGPAAGHAIARCASKYFLLLNSDTRLCAGAIARLRDYLAHNPGVGVVGPRLLNPDGSVQWSCFPFPGTWRWFVENDPIGLIVGRIPLLRRNLARFNPPTKPGPAPWVLGAAMAISREAFEAVGGFDDSFFMYYEEVDFSYRLQERGWVTHHLPESVIYHVGGVSTSKKRVSMLVQNFVSTIYFYRKHYVGLRLQLWLVLLFTKMRFKLLRDRARLRLVRDEARRKELQEDVAAWRLALSGPRRPVHAHAEALAIRSAQTVS